MTRPCGSGRWESARKNGAVYPGTRNLLFAPFLAPTAACWPVPAAMVSQRYGMSRQAVFFIHSKDIAVKFGVWRLVRTVAGSRRPATTERHVSGSRHQDGSSARSKDTRIGFAAWRSARTDAN